MRPKVLEISWHDTQPVYSIDFQPLPPTTLRRLLPQPQGQTPENERESTPGPGPGTAAAAAGATMAREPSKDRATGPVTRQYRLATCGGDSKVRVSVYIKNSAFQLWLIHPNIPPPLPASAAALAPGLLEPTPTHPPRAEYLATLSKHTAPVNVVRFSPNGQTLASAGDDGNIILWVKSEGPSATFGETAEETDKEYWRLQRMIQVTTKEVYDLAWSPDGEWILAGSTDNTATIWRASTGECVFALREHAHNVQGVAWDPLNEYIATQSSDRSVHVNSFTFRGGMPDVHPVSRASRMDIRHSRTPSFPTSVRPTMTRRGSTQSDAGSAITSASEITEQPSYSIATPLTPTTSVPNTPITANASMNPPSTSNKPGSRRSSFSGSQAAGSPSLSASGFSNRLGRSPSPIPPLPAIRAPPPVSVSSQRMYGDEGSTNFFRRLAFAPDGSLLLTPAGMIEDQVFKCSPVAPTRSLPTVEGDSPIPSSSVPRPRGNTGENGKPTVYIYSRANLARPPIAHLPGHKTSAVAVKFSPIFYELRQGVTLTGAQPEPKRVTLDRNDPAPAMISLEMPPPAVPADKDKEKAAPASVFALPYRLLFAVACLDSVLLYDTQQSGPIAIFKGLHYAGFTDVAWSPDGCSLMLSSSDGYCSIIVFDPAELGALHPTQQHHRQLQNIAEAHSHSHSHAPPPLFPSTHSPAMARASPAPPRSERESSTSSSIATPVRPVRPVQGRAPSSVSGTEAGIPTPIDERDEFSFSAPASSAEGSFKRSTDESDGEAAVPKKKRRVNLTHLGGLDQ